MMNGNRFLILRSLPQIVIYILVFVACREYALQRMAFQFD